MFDSLEPRRLFAADLAIWAEVSKFRVTYGASATIQIANIGTTPVTASFDVQFKAIYTFRTDGGTSGTTGPVFEDPANDLLATVHVTADVPASNANIPVSIPAMIPLPVSWEAGNPIYIAAKVDSSDSIAESDETNNIWYGGNVTVLTADRRLPVRGTAGADVIHLTLIQKLYFNDPNPHPSPDPDNLVAVYTNGIGGSYLASSIAGYDVTGLGGDDIIRVAGLVNSVHVEGGDGNDKISGGEGDDILLGGAGKDQIDAGDGNDRINGGGGNDKLFGGAGVDRLYGYAGNDYLDGGSSGDRLDGGAGVDTLLGQGGNDRFFAFDGEADQIFGASGRDSAQSDADDLLSSVES